MQTIEVMIIQNGVHTRSIQITDAQWEAINYVDYIELTDAGLLHPDFATHGATICERMFLIANGAR